MKWVTPAGGGKVLQVVQVSNTTDTTVASESYTDTGLSGSITPSSTSSKILVQYAQQVRATRTGNQLGIMTKLLRSSTTIYEPAGTGFSWFLNNDPIEVYFTVVGLYLDSPNTTSATTYKTQARCQTTTVPNASLLFQPNTGQTIMILMEIGV